MARSWLGSALLAAASLGTSAVEVLLPRAVRQRQSTAEDGVPAPSSANCTWVYVDQPLSHFAPGSTGGASWSQRICIYDKYWSGAAEDGPVFFYTGNESPVDEYVNGTGLMWETGPHFKALLIWVEHRYFGESVPELQGVPDCLAWLTSQEALADYAMVVEALRSGRGPLAKWRAPSSKVIAFGGSYGGMLTAWFRMKYPSSVDGGIAASAPIWGFAVDKPAIDGAFVQITNAAGPPGGAPASCAPNMKAAWVLLQDVSKTAEGRQLLSEAMGLCDPLTSTDDAKTLLNYLQDPLFNLAEGSYPFPTDYITYATFNGSTAPLPPWPMRRVCDHIAGDFGVQLTGDVASVRFQVEAGAVQVDVDWDQATGNGYTVHDVQSSGVPKLLAGVAKGLQVWYNVTGTQRCIDWKQAPPTAASVARHVAAKVLSESPAVRRAAPGSNVCDVPKSRLDPGTAWGVLCCNEGINLVNTAVRGLGRDLFWPPQAARNATMADVVADTLGYCASYKDLGLYGVTEKPDPWGRWMDAAYGGKNIKSHTNIFFSNGNLDPWTSAGVPEPGPTKSLPAVLIAQGGHHTDLFFSTDEDPDSIRNVRLTEKKVIASWLAGKSVTAEVVI